MLKLKERVGKVGEWKRLDLASLKRTKGEKAKRWWEEAKVEGRKRESGWEWEVRKEG